MRTYESVWLWGLLVLAVVVYYSNKLLPWLGINGFMGMIIAAVIVVVAIAGPYQFRVYREARRAEQKKCPGCAYGLSELHGEVRTVNDVAFTLVACPECGLWNGRRVMTRPK